MASIDEYVPIVGSSEVDELKLIAGKLGGKKIQQINSTAVGGGVAELLNGIVPLMRELGVETEWGVIKGGEKFFDVTKKFHNALHGTPEELRQQDFDIFLETSEKNIAELDIHGDIVFIHDPQPIALVKKKTDNKWIWRCHVDVSDPQPDMWNFLLTFLRQYDAAVFSAPSFSRKLDIRQFLIAPSIDPLSDKNRELPGDVVDSVFRKYGIPRDKPIITQISRFDRLKDPIGVIKAYRLVKRNVDCRLVLAGGGAADDPEGTKVYLEAMENAEGDKDVHVLLMQHNDVEINALQRGSDVIVQKSIKEGFALTVAEALWKSKPVVASAVGGIPLQVKHGYSGLLSYSIAGTAQAIKRLLNNPGYAKALGRNGRELVRRNFIITRQIKEHLLLFLALYHNEDIVVL